MPSSGIEKPGDAFPGKSPPPGAAQIMFCNKKTLKETLCQNLTQAFSLNALVPNFPVGNFFCSKGWLRSWDAAPKTSTGPLPLRFNRSQATRGCRACAGLPPKLARFCHLQPDFLLRFFHNSDAVFWL